VVKVLPLPTLVCEACAKSQARNGDILCSDCAYYYAILSELMNQHPELAANELDRLKEVFQWWEKENQLRSKRLTVA